MIDDNLFKKLKFTQGDRQKDKEIAGLRKLEAIEEYLKTMPLVAVRKNPDEEVPFSSVIDYPLRFELAFDSTLSANQEIPTTSCILGLYELASDDTLRPIHYLESRCESAWLNRLAPYFFTSPDGALKILLPAAKEIEVLRTLCGLGLLFYFDPEPKAYAWFEIAQPVHFMPQLQQCHDEWKLWGAFIDSQGNSIDLWDIQVVTPGGIARRDQQLFAYIGSTYPWIEALLSGGAIRCPEASLQEFLYHLLCLLDREAIQWPIHMDVTSVVGPTQPIFYVKTKDNKKNFQTKIEGFIWFRAEGFEYPSEVHQALRTPSRPKVFQVDVQKNSQGQYQVSMQIPDLETERACVRAVKSRVGVLWNEGRHSFNIELSHATALFYYLLHQGWEVWAENLQVKILKEIEIQLTTHLNWFEVELMAGKPATKISAWQLIHILKKQRMFIQLSDGSLGILPERWYCEFERLFVLRCPSGKEDDSLRFSTAHAVYLAQLAEMAENSGVVDFKGDPLFEQIRREIRNIDGLKPMAPAPTFRLTLRPYQELGLSWLHFLGRVRLGGCLADDMGLGKTVQILAYLDLKKFELPKGIKFRSLLVCPRSLLENWFQEARKCAPQLKVLVLRSIEVAQLASLFGHYDLCLISYGLARLHVQTLKQYEFDLLALDEAQLIKNSSAQITIAINQLRGIQRLAISGTPIENHMGEFFSLFEFLNPGFTHSALLKTLGSRVQSDAVPNPMLAPFLTGVRPLILRRLKREVAQELPDKLDQLLLLPMLDQQEKMYTALKNDYQDQLKEQAVDLFYHKSFFLDGLLRLRQVSCHPLLIQNSNLSQHQDISELSSNKFEFLIDQLKILVCSNHKAIVFSQFTSLLKLFQKLLNNLEIPYEYLDGQSRDRMKIVARFQENQGIPILLASIKAGGLGLNLTAADYCFILDPWWNPAAEQQAMDRIHRIGQDKPVNIYRIISQNTVEEKMLLLKAKKQDIADQLMTADHSFLERLNYEDFQFLLQ